MITHTKLFMHMHNSLFRRLFLALSLVALVTVVLVSTATYVSERNTLQVQVKEQLNTIADLKKTELTHWLDERQADVRMLAVNHLNQEHFTEIFDPAVPELRKQEFASFLADNLRGLQQSRVGYDRIVMVDLAGTVIISAEEEWIGRSLAQDPGFQGVMAAEKGAFIQDIHLDPASGRVQMKFGHILNAVNLAAGEMIAGQPIGAVLTTVDMEETVYSLIGSWPGRGETGDIHLVGRQEGRMALLSPPMAKSRMAVFQELVFAQPEIMPAVLSISGQEGLVQTTAPDNQQILAAYRHIPATGWGFIVQKGLDEILSPMNALTQRIVGVAFLIFTLAALTSFSLSRTLIRPLSRLVTATQAVAAGNLSVELDISQDDEVGALADAFRTMVVALEKRQRQVSAANDASHSILGLHTVDDVLVEIVDAVAELIGTEAASLLLFDEAGNPTAHFNANTPRSQTDPIPLDALQEHSLIQHLQGHSVAANLEGLETDRPLSGLFCTLQTGIHFLNVPIQGRDRILGTLMLAATPSHPIFSPGDVGTVESLASYAAVALENSLLMAQLRALNLGLEQQVSERTRELAEANARLTELDALKSEFVSNVSHELRTPVTNLKLYLSLLERQEGEKRTQYLAVLKNQADVLAQLIEDILSLSRLESKGSALDLTAVDMNTLSEEIIQAQRARAEAKDLIVSLDMADGLPRIQADRNQLRQVLTNLMANAINYTPEGSVRMRTYPLSGGVGVEVVDTGMGIDPEDLPHLFERFYRGQRVSQSSIPGTGLGLGIVKQIVNLHGGAIQVESEVNRGTTMRVWLPTVSPNAESEEKRREQVMISPTRRPQVLPVGVAA